MATVILNHKVKDFKTWKPLYDADAARRTGAGVHELAVGQKNNDPGNVFIIWKVDDPSVIEKMLGGPDLQKRMADGGVLTKPEVTILN